MRVLTSLQDRCDGGCSFSLPSFACYFISHNAGVCWYPLICNSVHHFFFFFYQRVVSPVDSACVQAFCHKACRSPEVHVPDV